MISIIIPTFNEEERLPKTLRKIADYVNKNPEGYEVIVVDDASTDGTGQVAQSFEGKIQNLKVLRLEKSPFAGKGYAVNKGVLASKGNLILFTDADGSTPIEEIEKLISKIDDGYDVAIGSRALERSTVQKRQNPLREYMGRTFNILVQTLTVKGIVDTQCGFKLFKRESTYGIFENQRIFDFGFDVEILYCASKKGLKIAEVPTLWYNDPRSSVHPVKDSLKMLVDLFKIRLYHSEKEGTLLDKIFYLIYHYRTFWRFSVVGATNTFVDYGIFIALTRILGLDPLKANPIAVELAILWSFTWNSIWTFSERKVEQSLLSRFLVFQFVSLGGLALSQTSLLLFNKFFNIYDLGAKALTIPIVLVFNYLLNSRWTFRDAKSGKAVWYFYGAFILILFLIYFWLTRALGVPLFGR
ncbi:MAG: bifunctional glycosyltransferase family 2/GtrA family protein [Candidatus Woykebacteria bacterium]